MKTNITISLDTKLVDKMRKKYRYGEVSKKIEELMKKELGMVGLK